MSSDTAITKTPAATRRLAAKLAMELKPGDAVVLTGQLGAGKTEFIRGVAEALGRGEDVASPSFVRVHSYGGIPPLYHADFYLANSYDDVADYGIEELTEAGGIVLIEWGERFPEAIPRGAWRILIEVMSESPGWRRIIIEKSEV